MHEGLSQGPDAGKPEKRSARAGLERAIHALEGKLRARRTSDNVAWKHGMEGQLAQLKKERDGLPGEGTPPTVH